ncbi:MAG: hypothetical protein IT286_05460 [Proteobacteria bacterium]|nr:hypothetical protein [Pseudomonadota bacterium]
MIDTIISLKLLLVLILGVLVLDEVFLGLQTAETVNFYAGRAALVDENVDEVDRFFNQNIFKYFIYTKDNPFVRINEIQTTRDNDTLTTKLNIQSHLRSKELKTFRRSGYKISTEIQEIHR